MDHRTPGERRLLGRDPAPAVYSIIALHLLGYDLDHPVMKAGLASLDRFAVHREDGARMIEACQSPVWDTCLATIALADAGLRPDHPALVKAADWMLAEEITRPGDWSIRKPELAPGGWAFEFHNDNYPDIDDTAEVVLALRRVRHPDPARLEAAIARGVRWNLGMQSRNGAWGAFDADNTSPFPTGCPSATSARSSTPVGRRHRACRRDARRRGARRPPRTREGIEWLLAEQEACGAWFGRWGVNYVYGTGSVVPALVTAGLPVGHPRSGGPSPGWSPSRTTTAAGARICAPTRRRSGSGTVSPPRPRPPGHCWPSSPRAAGTPPP